MIDVKISRRQADTLTSRRVCRQAWRPERREANIGSMEGRQANSQGSVEGRRAYKQANRHAYRVMQPSRPKFEKTNGNISNSLL